MKSTDLSAIWSAPDNSRLMKKQTSVRLATHIEARIAAICDMFPAKSKSQIINDLLAAALDEFANGFEFEAGKELEQDYNEQGPCMYERDIGRRTEFLNRSNNYLKEFELEAGNQEPTLFDTVRWREVAER